MTIKQQKKAMKQCGIFEKVLGSGEWWIRYVDAQGRYRREKAGTWTAARDLYIKRKQQALEGKKLPEKLRKASVPFAEITYDALAYSDAHKRSARSDHYRAAKLLDWFGNRSADSITPDEIEACFRGEDWTPATANRYRALLSLIYRLAIRNSKVRENPARLVAHRHEDNIRIRFLSPDEEKALRKAVQARWPERMSELELVLQTGLRLSEQYSLSWEDVD